MEHSGGKAEDIALAFDENGFGGIVNASRSLMSAYKSELWAGKDYKEATKLIKRRKKYANTSRLPNCWKRKNC